MRRRWLAVVGAVALVVPVVVLGRPASGAQQAGVTLATGTFSSFAEGATAVTYNPALVPFGAKASTLAVTTTAGTVVTFTVHGLVPQRAYGAHVHVNECGASPADAGPHYQHVPDPHQPSVDPRYANNRNEIWLDFHTDGGGNALALTTVDWGFTDRHAHAVMIHEQHTHTGDGEAGTAGARVACVNASL